YRGCGILRRKEYSGKQRLDQAAEAFLRFSFRSSTEFASVSCSALRICLKPFSANAPNSLRRALEIRKCLVISSKEGRGVVMLTGLGMTTAPSYREFGGMETALARRGDYGCGTASAARYVRVRSACPASVSLGRPSTRKRTSATRGRLACSVAQIESTVSVSVSSPDGWLAAKAPVRFTTASSGPSSGVFPPASAMGTRKTCAMELAPPGTG